MVIDGVNGLLFPPGDPEAFADRLVMYFTDNLGTAFAKQIPALSGHTPECGIVETIEQIAQNK